MQIKNGELLAGEKEFLDHGWTRLWIAFTAWASLSGWVLSLLHNLTPFAYALVFSVFACLGWRFRGDLGFDSRSFGLNHFRPLKWRNLFPGCFLLIFVLTLLGAIFHPPNNYDFLSYRFSRMLHWAAEDGWQWIDTADRRMNYSGTGFEWASMPIFLLTGTDRLIFLANIFSFALMPGLLFSVFRDLGLGRRPAWHWMWIFPSAYCYVMQAGSVGNDAVGAVYLLASVHFFCRAAKGGGTRDFWWGMVAAALLTGIKLSNLPLLLPCLVAALPALKNALRKPVLFLVFWFLGVMISILPIVTANIVYVGHWSGDPLNSERMQMKNPGSAFLGNFLQLGSQNLAPPILPDAAVFSQRLAASIPESWTKLLQRDFPRFALEVKELPQEEYVGLGLGVGLLLGLTLVASLLRRRARGESFSLAGKWVWLAVWISTLFFMTKMGSECTGRLLCSYYPLLIFPILLTMNGTGLTRKRWWRTAALMIMVSALVPLILTPSRPLIPVIPILNSVKEVWPGSNSLERAEMVYQVYEARSDVLEPLRKNLPDEVKVVGFLGGGDDIEVSLWRPFGERSVISHESGRHLPEWVILNRQGVQVRGFDSVETWLKENRYQTVNKVQVTSKVREGVVDWTIARSEKEIRWTDPFATKNLPGWAAFLGIGLAIFLGKKTETRFRVTFFPGENPIVMAFLRGWLIWVGAMVLSGWVLSALGSLAWMGASAVFFGTFILFHVRLHWRRADKDQRREVLGFLGYVPWAVVSAAILLASFLYSPVTLDSLTYRIPRILYWLQENKISYMPGCDARLNYMTPNWEWAGIPFFLLGSDRFLRAPSFLSWVVIYLIFCTWSKYFVKVPGRIRICAFLCVASSVWVLQGASSVNDLFASAFLLLSLFYLTRFERGPGFENLALSLFALALAAGTKPHFSVMAMPWVLWFLFSPSQPWKKILNFKMLWFSPLVFVCGPMPTFIINYFRYGSWKGEPEDPFLTAGHWLANILLGSLMMGWQMIQLPLNPLYIWQNSWLGQWTKAAGWQELVPRFSLDSKVALIVDGASFGLVSSVVLGWGLWTFFRSKGFLRSWPFYAGLAGLAGFLVAISQVVPGSVGRSFSGFVLLLFPAALVGLTRISERSLRVLAIAAFLSALFSLSFSATHPLWPVKTIVSFVEKYRGDAKFLESVKQYANFSLRYDTARDLVKLVPGSESTLMAIIPADRPLLQLWEPYRFRRKVVTFDKNVTPEEILKQPGQYLIVGPGFEEFYPQLASWMIEQKDFKEVASGSYVSKLERGPETWHLFKRKN